MPTAAVCGFILAGGESRRMGTDKALLRSTPDGPPQIERLAAVLSKATGSEAWIAGPVSRYASLGRPVVEDIFTGCGPLAGIHAALAVNRAILNLIVAVDLPNLTPEFLVELVRIARETGENCVIAAGQPLCGVYHRNCHPMIEEALRTGERRVTAVAEHRLRARSVALSNPQLVENMNTLSDWQYHLNKHE